MAELNFRPLNIDQDLPLLAEILNKVRIQQVTVERLQEWETHTTADRIRRTTIAESEGHSFVGCSLVHQRPSAEEGRFYIDIAVDPAQRRQGIGSRLYDEAFEFAVGQGVTILDADVYDNCPGCLRFAQDRGFTVDRHLFESNIDLISCDPSRFDPLLVQLKSEGLRFFSLAEAGDTVEMRRKLYEVNRRVSLDVPGSHGTFPSFEEMNGFFSDSWFLAEGQILAADGPDLIGISAVAYFSDTNSMENLITGVLPAYRGRKIAQALKAVVLRFAKSYGAGSIRTHNDSQNGPMLAINQKLGYKHQTGEYRLVRNLISH